MNLVIGKQYNTIYGKLYFSGIVEDFDHECDVCHKQHYSKGKYQKLYSFYDTMNNQFSIAEHIGSKCIKKFII